VKIAGLRIWSVGFCSTPPVTEVCGAVYLRKCDNLCQQHIDLEYRCIHTCLLTFIVPSRTQLHTSFPHLTSLSLRGCHVPDFQYLDIPLQQLRLSYFTPLLKQSCKSLKSLVILSLSAHALSLGTPAICFPCLVHLSRGLRVAITAYA